MPDTYKGLSVPRYDETADGVSAFKDFVDSGPVPRAANAAALPSPNVTGAVAYNLDTDALLVKSGASVGWTPPWNLPWGVVYHFQSPNNFILTTNEATINGFDNITFTAVPGRLYAVTVTGRLERDETAVERCVIKLSSATNVELHRIYDGAPATMESYDVTMYSTRTLLEPGTTSPVYKLRAVMVAGSSSTIETPGTASNSRTTVIVEDIGPDGSPT